MYLSSPNETRYKKIITFAGGLGTILEWYDFTIYAFLAPIISLLFFPAESKLLSLMMTYTIFAIGFLIRPLGAFLFGNIGDKYGRKTALIITILLMAFSTFMIGIIPSYKEIGIFASILLIVFRLLQGISVGGETIGTATFILESINKNKTFVSSITWASSGIGILLASLVVSITMSIFSYSDMHDYGWRIPFLLSAITGVVGFYLRLKTSEPIKFEEAKKNFVLVDSPVLYALNNHKRDTVKIFGHYILCALTTYLIFVYMPTYVAHSTNIDLKTANHVNSCTMLIMILLVMFFGFIADKTKKINLMLISSLLFLIVTYPIFKIILNYGLTGLIIGQLIFAILTAMYQGPITARVLESLPIHVRYTVAAVGYNVCYSIFGGTAPLMAIWLTHALHTNYAPAYYLIIGAFFSSASLII